MARTLSYSVSSVLAPLLVYAILFAAGLAPDRLADRSVYLPFLTGHTAGMLLAVAALSRSNSSPMDISSRMKLAVLLASVSLLLNIIGLEYILGNTVFHAVIFPPAGS